MSGEINRRLEQLNKLLNSRQLAEEAYPVFKQNTPINKGQARRKTSLKGSDIVADYPYAGRLDKGYSDQSPDGMIAPTLEHVSKYIKDTGHRGV